MSAPLADPAVGDVDFDYVLSASELNELITFMEAKTGCTATGASEPPTTIDAAPLNNGIDAPSALQFMPHPTSPGNSSGAVGMDAMEAPLGCTSPGLLGFNAAIKADPATGADFAAPSYASASLPCSYSYTHGHQQAGGPGTVLYMPLATAGSSQAGAQLPLPPFPPDIVLRADSGSGRSSVMQPPPTVSHAPGPAGQGGGRVGLAPAGAVKTSGSGGGSKGGALLGADGKPQVSHSMVEKQRRDRINSLIDELRDLVPPQNSVQPGSADAGPSADSKRPKHVVLSDTIQLVKELQDKMRLSGVERLNIDGVEARVGDPLGGNTVAAVDLIRRHCPDGSPSRELSNSSGGSDNRSANELPTAPEGMSTWTGVIVETGEGCVYVKVHCQDRRGLLSDVILALKTLPVEIKTAAITTTREGFVYDVFQVTIDPGSDLSPTSLQYKVHAALHERAGHKRRHTSGD